ncbi:MAG TPA: thioredoxin family protein [Lacipirellula sp.]
MNVGRGIVLSFLSVMAGCSPPGTPAATAPAATAAQTPEDAKPAEGEKAARPKLYDPSADGFEQIDEALAKAKREDKRVLLQFGAEWCGWCHLLHRLFESDAQIAKKLETDYVVVLVDVDGGHNKKVNEKYGNPMQHGLPVLVVLDADGAHVATQDTAELEEGDHHDPEKVMAFLEKWSPKGA